MSDAIISFQEALELANNGTKHLLLGNGFSISWKDSVFRYDSLFDQAKEKFSTLSVSAEKLFEALNTTDFESVMRSLDDSVKIVPVYSPDDANISSNMANDSRGLRDILIKTIANNHPEKPNEVTDDEYEQAIEFLRYFDGKIYTLNYDLLLYWVMMKAYSESKFDCTDGFVDPEVDASYVVWDSSGSNHPRVYFLHGALHLFDSGIEIQKYTWVRTQKRLIEQITEALDSGLYPLFVSEGDSDQKLKHIKHNDYLSRGYQSFSNIGRKKTDDALFIFGHSLSDNDDHILNLIPESNIVNVFISNFGKTESNNFRRKQRKVELLVQKRAEIISAMKKAGSRFPKKPLKFYFYDASSIKVWR